MIAGIAVDDWKLKVFRQRLTEAGFQYTDAGGLTPNATLLKVEVEATEMAKLAYLIRACQQECAESKR
jgi:hypothetical protein